MAKRNSAGSSGRRGSRSGSTKSFSSQAKSSAKPFKKSKRANASSGPSDLKDERTSGYKRKSDSETRKSAGKPFNKFEKKDTKKSSFTKKDERGFSGREGKSPTDRSTTRKVAFDKLDGKDSRKTYAPKGRDERGKSHSSKRVTGEKPFNKFGKDDLRKSFSKEPAKNSDTERSTERNNRDSKSFSRSPKASTNRPYRKFDETSSEGKSEKIGGEISNSQRKEKSFSSKPYSKRPSKREQDEKVISDPDKIRLNRYIANSGLCSRREADEFISMGLVTVNGKVITELGYKVNRTDEVRYEDKVLRAEKPVYILMNKPKGYLTTTKDPKERSTVMHILGSAVKERVYPVGRLDRNTTGLLLLTNDGDLADKLMHPSYKIKKVYKVELDRPITKADFKKIQDGVHLEEGKAIVDDLAIISDDNKTVGIELHIGWNRVVRRIFESLQYDVVKLDRSLYAGLDKKDLPRGHWRFLNKEEVVLLKHYK